MLAILFCLYALIGVLFAQRYEISFQLIPSNLQRLEPSNLTLIYVAIKLLIVLNYALDFSNGLYGPIISSILQIFYFVLKLYDQFKNKPIVNFTKINIFLFFNLLGLYLT